MKNLNLLFDLLLFPLFFLLGRRSLLPAKTRGREVLPLSPNPFIFSILFVLFSASIYAATIEQRVSSSYDDAEERTSNHNMYRSSSDLELVFDGSYKQEVGMRFTGMSIPKNATITNAYIQFTVDESDSGTTNVVIFGQDTDDASTFSSSNRDISNRTTTSASVSWNIPVWNSVGASGSDQRTPDLSSIVQEIINRGGWSSGNDMAFIVKGGSGCSGSSCQRTAESYNGSSSHAPLLHIEYTSSGGGGACNGCDCSLDTAANDSSPGVAIPGLDGATADVTKCISGESEHDDKDYYHFTVQASGQLDIATSSPNGHDYHMQVISSTNGTLLAYDTDQNRNLSYTVSAGERITVLFKETGSDLDEYEATFMFTKSAIPIIENADDLCYEDPVSSGMMCFDMGICDGGMGCRNTYVLKNIGNSTLSDVTALYDETGMGGSFGSSCGVDPSGSCQTVSNVNFGPAGFFGSATEYNLTNSIPPGDANNSIWAENFMSGSCFNGEELYGSYIKDGKLYRGKLKSCNAGPVGGGGDRPFLIRNPEDTRNISGNYAVIGNANQCTIQSHDRAAPWTGTCYESYSNNRPSRFLDSDNDTSTVNSTTSTLNIPADSEVVYAALYWQGVVHNSNENGDFMGTSGQDNGQTISGEPKYSSGMQIDFSASSSTFGAEKVKLKVPGGSYVEVTADVFDFYKLGYAGFKDITGMISANNPNGTYSIADIKSNQGIDEGSSGNHGNYASWSIVVLYKNPHEKFRNIALFDGYATVTSSFSEDLVMSGFLTPRVGPVNSKLAMFTIDGDNGNNNLYIENEAGGITDVQNQDHPAHSLFDSTISNSISRDLNSTSLRTDLKVLELEGVLNPLETTAILRPRSGGDRYTPSFFIMSAELIKPDLCYDYAYQQNGRYFTEENNGSKDPRIVGSLFSSSPVNVSLFIKNREDSDFTITNMKTSIDPIDTTQATYIDPSVKVILPGEVERHAVTPQSSGDSHISNVPIGTLGGKEFFYLYYDLDPDTYDIDMPLNASLDYNATFTLPNGTTIDLPPYHQEISSDIPLCADGGFSYTPVYGDFNVEHLNLGKYNIYTQVARRADNFEVTAYDANNTNTRINVSTMVAIEIIDAGAFHETQTTCQEPDSALTPRIWVTFDNNVSHTDFNATTIRDAIIKGYVSDQILNRSIQMDEPEDFYAKIRRNSAFRITANKLGNGDELVHLSPGTCQGNQVAPCYDVDNFPDLNQLDVGNGPGNCGADIDGNPSSNDRIPQYCGNAGNRGLDKRELSVCMECIYGYNVSYVCSRDNFAIRPEAFKVSLTDDNTSTVNVDFANNTDKSGSTASPIDLVAGYPYCIDINATSHTDENPVEGYTQYFDSNDARKRAYMAWDSNKTGCNAPVDRNMTFYLIDGTNTNDNPLNTWEDRHDTLINVGEYAFKVTDEEWTKYDWDSNLTAHHTGSYYYASADCTPSNDSVGATLVSRVGCVTSSVHVAPYETYTEVNIRSHPYSFYVDGLTIGARPGNDSNNTFVYINTLDTGTDDRHFYTNSTADDNMSYNVQGNFRAASYDNNKTLSNFVNNCYAEDVDMELIYNYTGTLSTLPALQYDLFDENISFTRINNPLASDNIIQDQDKTRFVKAMEGGITMDLGYNYDRTYNSPINPISFNMNDFKISYSTAQPATLYVNGINTHEILGNVDINKSVTFVYGRTKPNMYFYDNITTSSATTPVSMVAYCGLGLTGCQNNGLAVIASGLLLDAVSTNEAMWWTVQKHNSSAGDGNVTLTATNGTVSPADPTPINPVNGIDETVTVTNSGGTTPNIVDIDIGPDTDRWLVYNKDSTAANDATPHSPFYRVRFIGTSSWTGEGKTGHVVGDDINTKKTKRLEW